MKLRHAAIWSLCSLTLLSACGGGAKQPTTGSTTVGGDQPAASAGAGGAGGQGGVDTAGRKKAATAKLPETIKGMTARSPKDDNTIAVAMYTGTGGTPKVYLTTLKRIPPSGNEASMLEKVKTTGDVTCGVLAAGDKAPVCLAMLDGGMLSVNGGDTKETTDELATFAQALYDSFA
ncbi:hypothetical protein AAEX63_00120 [Luteococcus sp. H138]|uniref:hypothetical protein n=1 Tax=unclassified Luteococcus TaxID=2639923 RepID=UPI00313B41CB